MALKENIIPIISLFVPSAAFSFVAGIIIYGCIRVSPSVAGIGVFWSQITAIAASIVVFYYASPIRYILRKLKETYGSVI